MDFMPHQKNWRKKYYKYMRRLFYALYLITSLNKWRLISSYFQIFLFLFFYFIVFFFCSSNFISFNVFYAYAYAQVLTLVCCACASPPICLRVVLSLCVWQRYGWWWCSELTAPRNSSPFNHLPSSIPIFLTNNTNEPLSLSILFKEHNVFLIFYYNSFLFVSFVLNYNHDWE